MVRDTHDKQHVLISDNLSTTLRSCLGSKWNHVLAGCIAGSVPAIVLHPLDLVKIRFQANDSINQPSLRRTFSNIVRIEGWRALFQGLSPSLVGNCISTGLYFNFYERAKARRIKRMGGGDKQQLAPHQHLTAAAEAGVVCVLLTNPIWLIKTRMQLQVKCDIVKHGERPYKNVLDAGIRIVREEGFGALYNGIVPALMLVSHGALKFTAYEYMKTSLVQRDQPMGPLHHFVMGGSAHVFASTLTYPFQVFRTRLQQRMPMLPATAAAAAAADGATPAAAAAAAAPKYRGMLDCVQKTWRGEGVSGFYRGLVPNVLRVAPNSALMFLTYEAVLPLLGDPDRSSSSSGGGDEE